MRPHEKQSYGNIPINANGTGTAYCVAYHEDLNINFTFYLCKIDSSEKGLSACYFQDLQTRNLCQKCDQIDGNESEPEPNIIFFGKTIENHLGMHSKGCMVRSTKPEKGQMYSCIARREISADSVSSSLQGPEWSDPQEIGTFQFVEPGPSPGPVIPTKNEIEEIFIPILIFLSLCLLATVSIAGFILRKYRKKKKGEE